MKIRLFFLTVLAAHACLACAQVQPDEPEELLVPEASYPSLPIRAKSAKNFVPSGWVMEKLITRDLNRDGKNDLLMVLRSTDPNLVITHKWLGENPMNSNPRILAVALADKTVGDYKLAVENQAVIPRHEDPALSDPFSNIDIRKNVIQLKLGFWASMGGWEASSTQLSFRMQDGCFRLISYNWSSFHRATLDENDLLINTLTSKSHLVRSITKPKKVTKQEQILKNNPLLCLETIGDGMGLNTEEVFGVRRTIFSPDD